MNHFNKKEGSAYSEVNLKVLVKKVFQRKLLFAISLTLCFAAALTYIKLATPTYEVKTSLLIDSSGQSRMLGESKYVDGAVGLIGTEKNMFNEIGMIKSYSLVEQTLRELDFDVSYHYSNWYKEWESYGHFPFEVTRDDSSAQLFDVPFYVAFLPDDKFRLSLKAEEFWLSNPSKKTKHKIIQDLEFTHIYSFGEEVKHDYFQFTINKPAYHVSKESFEGFELFFQIHDYDKLANTYLNKLSVNQLDIQSSILEIHTTGPILHKETDFLQKLSSIFINTKYIDRNEIAASKENFIRNQLESVADSLARAERSLEAFKRGASAVDLTRSASNALDEMQKLETEQGQIELNIRYYNSLLKYINENKGFKDMIAPSVVGINDPFLNENLLELKRLSSEQTTLKFYKGEKSLDLELIEKEIKNTTNSLKENLKNLVESSRIALQDKNMRIARLENKIDLLPGNEKKLLNFERKRTLYENLYNYLSQELAKTGIARAENVADTKILDPPRMVGDGPVSPQKILILLLAGIIGLTLPLCWIIFADSFGEMVENSEQLTSFTNIPVVAKVFKNKHTNGVFLDVDTHHTVEEPFRDLGANLQFFVPDPERNVIGVTSSLAGEGKTFCAFHLAMGLAAEGKQILLLDLNFRKPELIKIFKPNHRMELSNYLQDGHITADDIIHTHKDLPSLFCIPTYEEGKYPHKLLSSPKLKTLINALKYKYDYVIIDSPAIGLVSDYLLLARHIDIHLFVIRRRMSKLSFLNDIEQFKRKGQFQNLFLVFNESIKRKVQNKYGYKQSGSAKKVALKQKSTKNWSQTKQFEFKKSKET